MGTIKERATQLWRGVEARASAAMLLYAGLAFAGSVMTVVVWERTPLGPAVAELFTWIGPPDLAVPAVPAVPQVALGSGSVVALPIPFATLPQPAILQALPIQPVSNDLEAALPVEAGQAMEDVPPTSEATEVPPDVPVASEATDGPSDAPVTSEGAGDPSVALTGSASARAAAPGSVPAWIPTAILTLVPTPVLVKGTVSVPAAVTPTVVAAEPEVTDAVPALMAATASLAPAATTHPSPPAGPARQENKKPPFEPPVSQAPPISDERPPPPRHDVERPGPPRHGIGRPPSPRNEKEDREHDKSEHTGKRNGERKGTPVPVSTRENERGVVPPSEHGPSRVPPSISPMPTRVPPPATSTGPAAPTPSVGASNASGHTPSPASGEKRSDAGSQMMAGATTGSGHVNQAGPNRTAQEVPSPPPVVPSSVPAVLERRAEAQHASAAQSDRPRPQDVRDPKVTSTQRRAE